MYAPGLPPSITTWDVSGWDPAGDLAARLAALPTDAATGQPALPSDALFVRLQEHAAPQAVAEVLLAAVATLSSSCSTADVQVRGTAQLLKQQLQLDAGHAHIVEGSSCVLMIRCCVLVDVVVWAKQALL